MRCVITLIIDATRHAAEMCAVEKQSQERADNIVALEANVKQLDAKFEQLKAAAKATAKAAAAGKQGDMKAGRAAVDAAKKKRLSKKKD